MARFVTVRPDPRFAENRLVCCHPRTIMHELDSGVRVRVCAVCGEFPIVRTPEHLMIAKGKQKPSTY